MSAMRFIKLLFQYKQPDAFTELAREMLQVLSVSRGIHSIFISSLCVYSCVSTLSLMCAVSLNNPVCVFVSVHVRVWKVNHSGGQSWSLLYLTVSTICCLPRGAVLKRTTRSMVSIIQLGHMWTYSGFFSLIPCRCLMNTIMRTTGYYFTVVPSCCQI